jgi:hypothetical protein
MSSTPMAIDSPIGANGVVSGHSVNGVQNAPTTAKLSDVISLYRPTKVSGLAILELKLKLTLRSCSVVTLLPKPRGKHLQLKATSLLLDLMMKVAFFLPLKVIVVCRYTISRKENITKLISVRNMAACMLCSLIRVDVSFIQVQR